MNNNKDNEYNLKVTQIIKGFTCKKIHSMTDSVFNNSKEFYMLYCMKFFIDNENNTTKNNMIVEEEFNKKISESPEFKKMMIKEQYSVLSDKHNKHKNEINLINYYYEIYDMNKKKSFFKNLNEFENIFLDILNKFKNVGPCCDNTWLSNSDIDDYIYKYIGLHINDNFNNNNMSIGEKYNKHLHIPFIMSNIISNNSIKHIQMDLFCQRDLHRYINKLNNHFFDEQNTKFVIDTNSEFFNNLFGNFKNLLLNSLFVKNFLKLENSTTNKYSWKTQESISCVMNTDIYGNSGIH